MPILQVAIAARRLLAATPAAAAAAAVTAAIAVPLVREAVSAALVHNL